MSIPKHENLRRADKSADEAVAVSAHLFVHLDEIADTAHPSSHAILEEVPGLSRTFIQYLISDVLRHEKYKFIDRHGEEKETYTLLDFHGLKSEKFGTALKQSTVPYVTLIQPGSLGGVDTEGLAVPREQRMKVILRSKPEQTLGILNRLIPWAKKSDWKDVLVRIDMPEKRSRVVSIARDADAADVLLVRSE
jgi:hypothetical protein